ncbi:hypothetical protein I7I53_05075 [Histoplasma capsulatum var. duboisii H88]|uniref:Uncharacterized protein n=1 Tax=Ajellomyces capsulatus (strain H88) TaxID=544711 RepID=A0A8A1LSM0_AJEC8|nr:hypothetical protein I7I53_05075 [Histoplasma capsulatum var. duboisii H88]
MEKPPCCKKKTLWSCRIEERRVRNQPSQSCNNNLRQQNILKCLVTAYVEAIMAMVGVGVL